MKLKKDDYEFLVKYVPEIEEYANYKIVGKDFIHFELNDRTFDNIQSDINDSIVAYGMDNQETVNSIGKRLYFIYDLLPYLNESDLEYFKK